MNESLVQLVTEYSFGSPETTVVMEKSPNNTITGATVQVVTTINPTSDHSEVNRSLSSSSSSSSPTIMSIQHTANDPSSNLHLLSKVIEERECDAMMISPVDRGIDNSTATNTSPKRVSLPCPYPIHPESTFSQLNTTPTSRVNEKEKMISSVKSWKKKAIQEMDEGDASSSSDTHPNKFQEKYDKNNDHDFVATNDDTFDNGSNGLLHSTTLLPPEFQPGPCDVLCGRGRACKDALGNKAYRDIIMNQLQIYADSTTKIAKGQIISNIMDQVKQQCYQHHQAKVGGFVKQTNGRWYDVGDFLAREKTSQCFRDALAAQYSSSAQSKYLRRRANKDLMSYLNDVPQQHRDVVLPRNGPDTISAVRKSAEAPEVTGNTNSNPQHRIKKMRYSSEETAVDALQQMASLSSDALVKLPPSCSPSPHISPKPTSNPSSATTSGGTASSSTAFTSLDFSTKLSAPSTVLPVATTRFERRSGSLPQRDAFHTGSISSSTIDLRIRPSVASAIFVCALQLALRPPDENPWDAMLRAERQMESIVASDSVDIFVLPELAPIGYSEDTFTKYLPINTTNQALYQEFDRFFQVAARKLNTYICYGTIGWSYENCTLAMIRLGVPRLFIRQIVVDRLGTQVACYDKRYLCNSGEYAESRYFQPGPASIPTSFAVYNRDRTGVYRFGLLISSDMRYPNLARTLVSDPEHAVDCILQPVAFVRDYSFRTWSSFRDARAVENSVFWIGINYAGTNHGETCVVPPLIDHDHEPITLDCEEGYVIGRVGRNTLEQARTQFPFYRNMVLEESIKLRNGN